VRKLDIELVALITSLHFDRFVFTYTNVEA